jgi:hypothetical protein
MARSADKADAVAIDPTSGHRMLRNAARRTFEIGSDHVLNPRGLEAGRGGGDSADPDRFGGAIAGGAGGPGDLLVRLVDGQEGVEPMVRLKNTLVTRESCGEKRTARP